MASKDMPPRFAQALGSNIRTNRKFKELSQKALGNLAGISHRSIAEWEKGHHCPSVYNLSMVADALEIDVATLIP